MEKGLNSKILANVMDQTTKTLPSDNAKIFNLADMSNDNIMQRAAQVLMCCNATLMSRAVSGAPF